jgi:hypothetical protein
MIDPTKCGVCYPFVFRIFKMKFMGEKEPTEVFMLAYRQCENVAIEHVEDYIDPLKPTTKFVLHRCAEHKKG